VISDSERRRLGEIDCIVSGNSPPQLTVVAERQAMLLLAVIGYQRRRQTLRAPEPTARRAVRTSIMEAQEWPHPTRVPGVRTGTD
jgi:hypothetical protein